MTITVANKRTHPQGDPAAAYVGRPTALGNPFAIGRDGTRKEVIARYREWLPARLAEPDSPEWRAFAKLLRRAKAGDLTLVCWCHPEPCHADVIAAQLAAELATICGHGDCIEPGQPCWLPDDPPDSPGDSFCRAHMFAAGYCPGCHAFWGGVEAFEFGPGLCPNCRDDPDYDDGDDAGSDAEGTWFVIDDAPAWPL